ncbi:NAD(P)-dependent oxidoreductase [Pelosinus sp. UFO1]|uniref:NAD-dependent epimerase/dehydratase family protein n=1 Tax=Pelosinus sp. UFO1 TaxID=484770 RepID=UPI0004D19B13|nr:NAD(P)-dependent oxidoreductase [Pelosinus sp. UFO1]AIF53702.1 hypothetical protein UFO1_4159 [Pelosinus sp. UFO1]
MLLVTGITGHTGRYFLQELIDHKYEDTIRCVVRANSDKKMIENSGLKIEMVVGDLNDTKFLDTCLKDVTTVLHIPSIRYSLHIVEAAIKNNVPRAILVHTTGIYSKFKAASGEYKIIEKNLQDIAKNQQVKITILRPTMIYGDLCDHNISKFIKMLDKLRMFPVIDHGNGLIQPVNARNLGKAYYSVLTLPIEKAKEEYILSGEKPITMLEAFKLININLGKETIFISVPSKVGVFLARCMKGITFGKVDYIERVQRMSEDRCFSHEEAMKDFNYKPMSFEDGIEIEVKEYLKLQNR